MNEGKVSRQTVPHLHIHIVPRKLDDNGIIEYKPRQFLYRPGIIENSSSEEESEISEKIAHKLSD